METWKTGHVRRRKKVPQLSLLVLALIQATACTSGKQTLSLLCSFCFSYAETCEKNLEILSTTRLYECPRWQRGNEKFASNFHFLVCNNNNSATILMMMYEVLLRLPASSLVLLRLAELVSQVSCQDVCVLTAAILNDERKRLIYSSCVVYHNILIQNLTMFNHLNLLTSNLIPFNRPLLYEWFALFFSVSLSLSLAHTQTHTPTHKHTL